MKQAMLAPKTARLNGKEVLLMANLANPERTNGTSATMTTRRSSFGEWFGLDPLDLFRNFYSPLALDATVGQGGLDISRTENGYIVEIPVAGFRPEQIDVTFKDNVLSISGKSERRTFTRSLVLPDEIDPDHVDARVEHGLLTLNLNRHPETEPKRIQIKVN
jgi:HSP20 family protein